MIVLSGLWMYMYVGVYDFMIMSLTYIHQVYVFQDHGHGNEAVFPFKV